MLNEQISNLFQNRLNFKISLFLLLSLGKSGPIELINKCFISTEVISEILA